MDQSKQCLVQIKQLLDSIEEDDLPRDDSSLVGCAPQTSLPMPTQLATAHTGGPSCPRDTDRSAVTFENLPGRGIGIVATRFIPAGSIILQEDATLTIRAPNAATAEFTLALVSQYVACSAEVRRQVLSLCAYICPGRVEDVCSLLDTGNGDVQLTEHQIDLLVRLPSIFTTNMFDDDTAPEASCLYLQASRFNHSCLPNCDYGHNSDENRTTITIRASRDIQPNEELCITYVANSEPRGKRMAGLEQNWGFVCGCPACDMEDLSVDTAAHEEMLAEYRGLRKDPYAEFFKVFRPNPFDLEELEEALKRCIRRIQIAELLGDVYTSMGNQIMSGNICRWKWYWTGDTEDAERRIGFLERAKLLAERQLPSDSCEALVLRMERLLSKARKLQDTL